MAKDETRWSARTWLDEVREAVRLLNIEEAARHLRREQMFAISDPLGHEGAGAGVTNPMGKVDAALEAEAGYVERVAQLTCEIADCKMVVSGLHAAGKDDEAYIVELHVLHRLSWVEVARKGFTSVATARRRYEIACDLIQSVGLSRARVGDYGIISAEV